MLLVLPLVVLPIRKGAATSVPSTMLMACSRWTKYVPPPIVSFVLVTTYRMFVVGSMTGVPVMPISGLMSELLTSALVTVEMAVAPSVLLRSICEPEPGLVGSRNVRFQSTAPAPVLLASSA